MRVPLPRISLNPQNYPALLFTVLIIMVITSSMIVLGNFTQKYLSSNTKEPKEIPAIDYDIKAVKNIDILVKKDKIEPYKVTLKANTNYVFRILRQADTFCDSMENNNLGYVLNLPTNANRFPLNFPTPGNYDFDCNRENTKLSVTVE